MNSRSGSTPIAQRLEAAVFGDGLDQFFIVTTRNMLQNVFLKDNEHSKLLQFGQRSPQYRVWLGMGVGNTMLEARSRAAMALNHSIADRSGTSYLVENEGGTSSPIGSWDVQTVTYRLERFVQRTRLGMSTLRRLAQVLRQPECGPAGRGGLRDHRGQADHGEGTSGPGDENTAAGGNFGRSGAAR